VIRCVSGPSGRRVAAACHVHARARNNDVTGTALREFRPVVVHRQDIRMTSFRRVQVRSSQTGRGDLPDSEPRHATRLVSDTKLGRREGERMNGTAVGVRTPNGKADMAVASGNIDRADTTSLLRSRPANGAERCI